MSRHRGYSLACIAVLSAAVSLAGCAEKPRETGAARVSAAVRGVSPGQITRLTLTISGGSLSSPHVQNLTRVDDTRYSGTAADIPVGSDYTFLAEAFGGTPEAVLYRGQATGVAIAAAQAAQVTIALLEVDPTPGPVSKVPVLDALAASAAAVVPGAAVQVSVTAHSPEGHALTYSWQAGGCGSFANATQASTEWTAPASDTVCQLSVRVADAAYATAVTGYLAVVVRAPTGSAEVVATVETYPVLTLAVDQHVVSAEPAPSGLSVGITADVVLTASDPDGDALTVAWSSSCGGTFSPSASATTVRFHHDDPAAECTLTVEVSDGRGGVTTGTVELSGTLVPPIGTTAPPTVFYSALHTADGKRYVHSVALDGTGDAVLAEGWDPRVSPDGSRMVYRRGGTWPSGMLDDLFVMDFASGAEVRVFDNPDYVVGATWLRDGSRVLFDFACNWDTVAPDGTYLATYGTATSCYEDAPDVNPTFPGAVAYHDIHSGIAVAMYGIRGPVLWQTKAGDTWPRWSPDGLWVSFMRGSLPGREAIDGVNYFKLEQEGELPPTQLTFLAGDAANHALPSGAWTPDGAAIVAPLVVDGRTALYRIAADGSGAKTEIPTPPGLTPDFVGSVR